MSAATDPTTPPSNQLSIVVGLDFSDADGPAFDQATRIARHVPHGELHLLHVFGTEPSAARLRDLTGHLRLYVNEKAAASASGLGGVTVGIHLRAGKPVREIVQLATEVRADLIVVGSHRGPHLKHWILGSTAEKLVLGAPCPVLVASPPPKEPVQHEPTIEPACPQCLQTRAATKGSQWWCERHSHLANSGHAFSYQREIPFAFRDSEVIPTGIDF